jgi:hypothetical protein
MWWKHMLDRSNTPVRARVEDQPLIRAIGDARRRYRFSAAAAEQLLNDFAKPEPKVRRWIFELSDPAPRANPFVTDDLLAAFARDVLTRGRDSSARWADLTPRERRQGYRIARFAQDKRRVRIGAGRPKNVDQALILYVIRGIEEATGVAFRFARPRRLQGSTGGPMLRLAEEALRRLFRIADNAYLGLVSPARHYTREQIVRTAKLVRRASTTSPAKWQSDLILTFTGDVRMALVGEARQENQDRCAASPYSWGFASSWGITREALEAVVASGRQTRLNYGSWLDVLQASLKNGTLPDLIELSKRRCSRPMILVAERTLPEPPTQPPPSTDGSA